MNSRINLRKAQLLILALFPLIVSGNACSKFSLTGGNSGNSQSSSNSNSGSNQDNSYISTSLVGDGSFTFPTSEAVVYRIQNATGLSAYGNYAFSNESVKANLPRVTDVLKATGVDQVQLMSYRACTGFLDQKMRIVFHVDSNASVNSNKAVLIAAGMTWLDNYTAGLASNSPASADVKNVLSQMVDQMAADSSITTTMAFMSVCMAANTVGSSMLGF